MPTTKTLGALSAILLATAVTTAEQDRPGAKPPGNATTDATIVANEQALHDAALKGDKAAFRSLVLPDGVWTTSHGFVPVKLLVDGLDGFRGITKWEMVNPHVTWLDDGAAVLLYVRTATGTFEEQPVTPTALASTVWIRHDGKWLAVLHQETELTK